MIARICEIFTGGWIMFQITAAWVDHRDRTVEQRHARKAARR